MDTTESMDITNKMGNINLNKNGHQNKSKKDTVSDPTTRAFFTHSAARRVNTDCVIASTLTREYPDLKLVIAPTSNVDLLGYAAAGHATATRLNTNAGIESPLLPPSLVWKSYVPPARRIDGNPGALGQAVIFAKYLYKWNSTELILYLVDGRDGDEGYPQVRNNYLLAAHEAQADALVMEAGRWTNELHDEFWVYDAGAWQKSAELFQNVMKASWDAVILDEDMKKAIIKDHRSFFDSREAYDSLKVPWKRGLIYYGPPGNGKTISIKATMHMLYEQKKIPSLYVRNFVSWMGPEYAIATIFALARRTAPCYLIFEDLDSLVTDQVRSYFLNEIDGLKSNDGIFIVGSTNHLERLDPGISKRPSRFDRMYQFPDPNFDQRVAYCRFWQKKLADNKAISFPDKLCEAIADITHDFSFAYIQEAFVAALLAIARDAKGDDERAEKDGEDGWVQLATTTDDELDDLVLWVEIQKQVAILRESIDRNKGV
ncbi:putative ATPase [Echria macrotheca]|uniref:ATPase n=1 Tax=Echria macrotheca TaxID=438768 RepID=A0AAJ0F264_9PEZI|nr:putative ATPase [Echria macrotheca]